MHRRRLCTSRALAPVQRRSRCRPAFLCLVAIFLSAYFWPPAPAVADELNDAQSLYKTGKYAECAEACDKAIESGRWGETWWILKMRAQLTLGQYPQAMQTYEASVKGHEESVSLRLIGVEANQLNNHPEEANELLLQIRAMAEKSPWQYGDLGSRMALGRALLHGGGDARQVLELFYDKAKKENPQSPEPYLASGELALEKSDFAMAAESFQAAIKRDEENPDAYYGLAQSFDNDAERASKALDKALELNPRHVGGLLLQADNLIDREGYKEAEAILAKVLEINPKHPRAWAYRTVLAHLAGDKKAEDACRAEALSSWPTNPEVEHVIGLKLSQKYRFAEGASHQAKALEFSPTYRPASVQLCQDLLRLGKEEEGWGLADEAFKSDPYNVVAYNLLTLRDNLAKFQSLREEGLLVRMDPHESQIYGPRVLDLLARARKKLCEKYGVTLPDPVTVEIFPQQKDFAIRTFGLPGGAGFLGVCFGPVVTVNSPASRVGHASNWEAVIWHEFCHSVTLSKTHNKMPRWLSEGISVYEERQETPYWGQAMTPRYRELVLAGGATPVSKLSGAFLKPPTPTHLMFAYYESSMVVQYVVDHFGASALKQILTDLGGDMPINDALARSTEPIEKLDENFAKYLKEIAEQLAPKADWETPDLPLDADSTAMAAFNQDHPNNFRGLLGEGRALLAERKFAAAKKPLIAAIDLYPNNGEAGGPYLLLAAAHRELGETDMERQMLQKHVALSADSIEPRLRLIEIAAGRSDWTSVRDMVGQVLAINPLTPAPYKQLLKAADALGERSVAIDAHRTLLMLDPLDRAEHHYQLARLLTDEKKLPEARRQVLLALEEAPRFRAAHQLLLKIVAMDLSPTSQPATTPTARSAPASAEPAPAASPAQEQSP